MELLIQVWRNEGRCLTEATEIMRDGTIGGNGPQAPEQKGQWSQIKAWGAKCTSSSLMPIYESRRTGRGYLEGNRRARRRPSDTGRVDRRSFFKAGASRCWS